jgi:hypothetical protein
MRTRIFVIAVVVVVLCGTWAHAQWWSGNIAISEVLSTHVDPGWTDTEMVFGPDGTPWLKFYRADNGALVIWRLAPRPSTDPSCPPTCP